MANNVTGKDASGTSKTFKTTDNSSVHTPHKNIDVIAGGASPDIGTAGDMKVITDASGSMLAFLRGIVYLFATRIAALGQAAMSASQPVVIANDQSTLSVAGAVTNNGPAWTRGAAIIVDSADASGGVDVSMAPTSGLYNVIDSLFVSVGAALTVTILCETTLVVLYKAFMAANTSMQITELTGYKLATVNKKVRIQTSGAGNCFAVCQYHSEV